MPKKAEDTPDTTTRETRDDAGFPRLPVTKPVADLLAMYRDKRGITMPAVMQELEGDLLALLRGEMYLMARPAADLAIEDRTARDFAVVPSLRERAHAALDAEWEGGK